MNEQARSVPWLILRPIGHVTDPGATERNVAPSIVAQRATGAAIHTHGASIALEQHTQNPTCTSNYMHHIVAPPSSFARFPEAQGLVLRRRGAPHLEAM